MNIAFVSSKGGHLGQIKLIFTNAVIGKHNAILVTETSDKDLSTKEKFFNNKYKTYFFKKDYLGVHRLRYLMTMRRLMRIFRKEKIDLVVTNGAHLSIPAVIGAKLMGIKTLFIDTVIRVKTPNWSERASYPFSDIFLVQHKSMAVKYGKKAEYVGGVL